MTSLEKAIRIALDAHTGQKDKSRCEYILHPLRVMLKMDTQEERLIAILHDVVEDSEISIQDLESQGFDRNVLDVVALLTRDKANTPYEDFIRSIGTDPLAVKIKIAGLEDNMNITRISEIGEKDIKRLKRYHWAWHFLKKLNED